VISILGHILRASSAADFLDFEAWIASGVLIPNQLFCHGKARVMLPSENGRLSGVSETSFAKSHPRIVADFSVSFPGETREAEQIVC
jgi:hypothetical protein